MVARMIKKNAYIIILLILYLLFLCQDHLLGFLDNTDNLMSSIYDEKLTYYQNEYEEMQKLLNIEVLDYQAIYSKVILRDIYAFYDEITIGKGSYDGVSKGDLVVNEKGVIGLVKSVNNHTSIVELLTNSNIELSVKINQSYGILTSVDNEIIVKNVKLDDEIKVGDFVTTSGLTSVPGEILVGKVSEIKTDTLGLEYILEVDAVAYLQDISYVAVLGEVS
mgnify:CR=1 FL=1